MTTVEQVILAILAAALALLLVLSIVAVVMVIKLIGNFRRIAEKAESLADSAEAVGDLFRKSAVPVTLFRFMRGVSETARRHKSKHEED